MPQSLPSPLKARHSPGRSGHPPPAMSAPKPPCTHAALTRRPHHPPGILLEYHFVLIHQGAAAAPHGGILGRKGPFSAGQRWAPHSAPSPVPQDRAEPAGAVARTRPSENAVLERRGRVRLVAAGPAGAATCFPSLRGAALSRELLLRRTQKGLSRAKSTAGRGNAGREAPSPHKLPGAMQAPRSALAWGAEDLPAQGQVSAQSEKPGLPHQTEKNAHETKVLTLYQASLAKDNPPREPLTCPPRHRD